MLRYLVLSSFQWFTTINRVLSLPFLPGGSPVLRRELALFTELAAPSSGAALAALARRQGRASLLNDTHSYRPTEGTITAASLHSIFQEEQQPPDLHGYDYRASRGGDLAAIRLDRRLRRYMQPFKRPTRNCPRRLQHAQAGGQLTRRTSALPSPCSYLHQRAREQDCLRESRPGGRLHVRQSTPD